MKLTADLKAKTEGLLITFDVFKSNKNIGVSNMENSLLITFDVFKFGMEKDGNLKRNSLLITFDVFK